MRFYHANMSVISVCEISKSVAEYVSIIKAKTKAKNNKFAIYLFCIRTLEENERMPMMLAMSFCIIAV